MKINSGSSSNDFEIDRVVAFKSADDIILFWVDLNNVVASQFEPHSF